MKSELENMRKINKEAYNYDTDTEVNNKSHNIREVSEKVDFDSIKNESLFNTINQDNNDDLATISKVIDKWISVTSNGYPVIDVIML